MNATLKKSRTIQALRNGLIVSCQPRRCSAFDHPKFIAMLASVAEEQGAVAVRINGPQNIRAVRRAVNVPIVGIEKIKSSDCPVYITPTIEAVKRVLRAGAEIVALDATGRPRPRNQSCSEIIHTSRAESGAIIMADIATLQQGLEAAKLGVDLISTTLYGYTEETLHCQGPGFALIRDLVREVAIPVILEGRVHEPEQVQKAFDLGAYAVVVGTAITDFEWLTRRFIEACPNGHGKRSARGSKSLPRRPSTSECLRNEEET